MTSKSLIKPLESVVSAIHCLKEKDGSTPQNIINFLEAKYNIDEEQLKRYVQAGLRRGLAFGMITHDSGLYRLSQGLYTPYAASMWRMKKCPSKKKSNPKPKTKKQTTSKRTPAKKSRVAFKNRMIGFEKYIKGGKALTEEDDKKKKAPAHHTKRRRRPKRKVYSKPKKVKQKPKKSRSKGPKPSVDDKNKCHPTSSGGSKKEPSLP